MDRSKNLILKNSEDIIDDAISRVHNLTTHKYDIIYRSGKTYSHNYFFIEWMTDPKAINPNLVRITTCGVETFPPIDIICVFSGTAEYWLIRFSSGKEKTYSRPYLNIVFSCLNEDEAKNCLEYLRQIAAVNNLKNDDEEVLLQKQ